MPTQRIKLIAAVSSHQSGKTLAASTEAIASHGLVLGKDYEALGTYPYPAKSDLSIKKEAKSSATKKIKPINSK